jgi:hypothetical protein
LVVKDESGSWIASEGDELTQASGGIQHNWQSEEYRQLFDQLSGDCHASYWIVDN